MTPEEVAKNFQGDCVRNDNFCLTHQRIWRQGLETCPVLTDYIDMCEQAMEEALKDERARAQSVVVGVTGGIQERGEALGREEALIEVRAKVQTLMPANPQSQIVHEMFVAGYGAAIAAVLGLLEGINNV